MKDWRCTVFIALLAVAACAHAAIAVDVNISQDRSSSSTTIVSPTFTTVSGNELLLAFIETDYLSGTNTTVRNVAGAGLVWTLVVRSNGQRGTSEIWRAFAPSPLTNVSVTATLSQRVLSSMTVMTFTGVDTSGVNGSGAIGATASRNGGSGAPSASVITTRANSWVFGVGNDYDNAIARTVPAGQSLVHQYLTPAGDTYWVQMQNAPTPISGATVTINDAAPTSDRWNLAVCEILPPAVATQTWSISGSITPSAAGSGATITLTGAASATTTADASGNYSFSGAPDGNYTVTPAKNGYTFDPVSQSLTINGANATAINFTATAIPTWSISGTISPASAGASATVTLNGAAKATTTADAAGNYSFTGLANGAYTVTPSKAGYTMMPASQSATVSDANVSGVNFTAQTASVGSLGIDIKVSTDGTAAAPSITSPAFSTTVGNELLLAFIATDYLAGANTTVTSVSGGGLTWNLVVRSNGQAGTSEIWRAFAAGPLSNISVTASLSQSVISSITVVSFTGADTSGANGSGAIGAIASKNAASGAPGASLVTTRNNSWVFGVGNDYDRAVGRTAGSGQSIVHQYLTPAGDTYWVQMQNSPTPAAGATVSINDTSPTSDRWNLSLCEVLPAASGVPDATPPTVSVIAPAQGGIVTTSSTLWAVASDNASVAGVQFFLDGAQLGSEVTTPPYSMVWDTSTVANGQHTITARARDTAGNTAMSAAVSITVDRSGNPAVMGSWSSVVNIPTVAVNLILLNNNKVLLYQDGMTPTVWDYINNTFQNIPTSADLFCSGHALLADGRVLVAGGYGGSGSNIGIANAEIFDPSTNKWTAVPNMAYKRWYPTATTLSDGRVLVTAGWQTASHTNAGVPEIYDPVTNKWTQLPNAYNPFETYPFMYLLPDGRVIHVGGSEYAVVTDILDLNTQSWSVVDPNIVDGGSSAMYVPGKIMKAGSAADSQDVGASTNTTYVLDMTQPSPKWQQTPSMVYPRSFLNLTTLPDGTVLATGGETDKNGGNIANAVYAAELWSPQTQTWTTMASMHTPREYHSTAVLLPDGRVLVSGMGSDFGQVPDEKNAEFFSPPYLFKGARPAITQAPAQIQYGSTFFVGTPDAASIASAVLIRTGAVTHFFDENARFVPLAFQQTAGGLTISAPANGNLAPPGYYMLFLVNSNGVPSVAPFVQIQ